MLVYYYNHVRHADKYANGRWTVSIFSIHTKFLREKGRAEIMGTAGKTILSMKGKYPFITVLQWYLRFYHEKRHSAYAPRSNVQFEIYNTQSVLYLRVFILRK